MQPQTDLPNANAIAIIGMAARLPGAVDTAAFWRNLAAGVESIRRFSREELLAAGVAAGVADHPDYVPAHGALDDIASFDAAFFGYTPAEATLIDPQQRLFLECAYEALEHAGYAPRQTGSLTGVFGGCGISGYLLRNVLATLDLEESGATYQASIGNDKDYLTSRVAYTLDLGGPSVTVQAACATSLVAVHAACQSLLNGECDMALAGGVSLRVPQQGGHLYQAGGIQSADGHCRAFDAAAGGTVGGSGAGIVVLKRLEDAEADGDHVLALILGSAVNNDGARKLSFTAPGVDGQTAVIVEAQAVAGVAPDSISYVEAHGTGTSLGDPIEIAALGQAFGSDLARQSVLIGSVKPNIGHLDSAAGIAGLIKTVLALQHELIPPSLHFQTPNPNIDFARSPFRVCSEARPWPVNDNPRRAGVSSFGLGGNNSHVVLQEAPPLERAAARDTWRLLPLSARSDAALARKHADLQQHLQQQPALRSDDVAWTLAKGRELFRHAGFVVARDLPQLGELTSAIRPDSAPRIAFLYPGQGAQHVGAGRDLYAAEPVFRAAFDDCAAALIAAGGADIRTLLFTEATPEAEATLRRTRHAQPALFALGFALTALWAERGVRPAAVVGHSAGEYAALVSAGVLSLADAARLITQRALLMDSLPGGVMAAVGLSEAELTPLLPAGLVIAAVNAPSLCTVSGDDSALKKLETALASREVFIRRLATSHAFHSPAVEPILSDFRNAARSVRWQVPTLAFYSAVSGGKADVGVVTNAEHWVQQIRQPVRFGPALQALVDDGYDLIIDIGPAATLASLARQASRPASHIVAGLPAQTDAVAASLQALGQVWLAGIAIAWDALFDQDTPRRVPLPTYPFERSRHWLDASPPHTTQSVAPTRAVANASISLLSPSWQRLAPLPTQPAALAGHTILFAHDDDLSTALHAALQAVGASVSLIRSGPTFTSTADGWQIRPEQDEDFAAMWQALAARLQASPLRLIHAWTLDDMSDSVIGIGFFAVVRSLRTLAQAGISLDECVVLTTSACDVSGDEALNPCQALLLGPVLVAPSEFPQLQARLLDLPVSKGLDVNALAQRVLREIAVPGDNPVIALRNQHRWAFKLVPNTAPAPALALSDTRLRDNGVYLFTGSAGGIAGQIALRMAELAKLHIVFITRRAMPPVETWNDLQSDDPSVAQHIATCQQLQQRGARVSSYQADCADLSAMRAVLARVRADFGALHGVIHAAGVAGGGAIALRSDAQMTAVLRPKVEGTRVLAQLLQGQPLDFFVLFSSINALLPIAGQVDYSAANAYLDAAAVQLRRLGIPALTVSWDAWRDIGMAARGVLPEPLRALRDAELAEFGLDPALAADALLGLLGSQHSHVVVTTARRFAHLLAPASAVATVAEPALGDIKDSNNVGTVAEQLAAIWQTLLGVGQIKPSDDFFQLGGHSLLATRLTFRIRQQWGVNISLEDIFSHAQLQALASLIEARTTPSEPDLDRETFLL